MFIFSLYFMVHLSFVLNVCAHVYRCMGIYICIYIYPYTHINVYVHTQADSRPCIFFLVSVNPLRCHELHLLCPISTSGLFWLCEAGTAHTVIITDICGQGTKVHLSHVGLPEDAHSGTCFNGVSSACGFALIDVALTASHSLWVKGSGLSSMQLWSLVLPLDITSGRANYRGRRMRLQAVHTLTYPTKRHPILK